jgi:hypothetical protein
LKLFYIGTCSADESCSFEVNRQNFYIGTASCTTRTQQAMRRHRKQHRRSWPEHLRHRPTPAQDIWTVEKITVTSFAWRNLLWFENAQHSYISKRLLKSFQVGARILVNCEVFATNSAVIQLLWIFRGHRAVWPVESDADEHWHTHTHTIIRLGRLLLHFWLCIKKTCVPGSFLRLLSYFLIGLQVPSLQSINFSEKTCMPGNFQLINRLGDTRHHLWIVREENLDMTACSFQLGKSVGWLPGIVSS